MNTRFGFWMTLTLIQGFLLFLGCQMCSRKFSVSFVFFLFFFVLMLPLLVGDLGVTLTGSQPVIGELGTPSSMVLVRQRSI